MVQQDAGAATWFANIVGARHSCKCAQLQQQQVCTGLSATVSGQHCWSKLRVLRH